VPVRESQSLLDGARQQLDPLLPASNPAISFHPSLAAKEVVARFRGLACVRWHESGIYFASRELKTKWDPGKRRELEELFRELENFRRPLASETRQPLFRAQSERWLEFLVRQDVTRIDASLDQRFAFAQVLATTAGEHGILDVLSSTCFEVAALRDSMQSLLKQNRKNILLNLSGLQYLDSSGIGELACLYVLR
jgi:hypothetical protein